MADASLVANVVAASTSAGIDTTPEAVSFALGFATAMNAPRLSTAPFTLYYHETFSGRAQPVFMMLADAGVEYERKTTADVTDPTVFAVPAVECGGEWRSQTLSVARFVAERTGYEVPVPLGSLAEKIALDIGDVWAEAFTQAKRHQGAGVPDEWLAGRLTRWLRCLDASLRRTGAASGGVFCVGTAVSFLDFLLLNLVLLLECALGEARARAVIGAAAPAVAAASDATRARPKVAAYLRDCGEAVLFKSAQAPPPP